MESLNQSQIDRKNKELENLNSNFQSGANTKWKSEEEIKGDGGYAHRHQSYDYSNMDFLECQICREEFVNDGDDQKRNPIVISCGHTFCQVCIKDLGEKNSFHKCPKCAAILYKFQARNYELQSAIEWAQRSVKRIAELNNEIDILKSYHKLGVKNPRQVQYVLEDIMAKSNIPGATLTPEQASQMIVRACQATKKDVIERTVAFMRKEKETIEACYREQVIQVKRDITQIIDLKKFHKFSMVLHQDPITIKSLQNQIQKLVELRAKQESENDKLRTTIGELTQSQLKTNLENNHLKSENQRLAQILGDIESLKRENENLMKGFAIDQSKLASYKDLEKEHQQLRSQLHLQEQTSLRLKAAHEDLILQHRELKHQNTLRSDLVQTLNDQLTLTENQAQEGIQKQKTLKAEASTFQAELAEKDLKIKNQQAVIDKLAREIKAETEKYEHIIEEVRKKQERKFFNFRIMPGEEQENLKNIGAIVILFLLILFVLSR